jgi:hypothetical protein
LSSAVEEYAPANIIGTARNDTLRGTPGADRISRGKGTTACSAPQATTS